jgi:hypothetical protein
MMAPAHVFVITRPCTNVVFSIHGPGSAAATGHARPRSVLCFDDKRRASAFCALIAKADPPHWTNNRPRVNLQDVRSVQRRCALNGLGIVLVASGEGDGDVDVCEMPLPRTDTDAFVFHLEHCLRFY